MERRGEGKKTRELGGGKQWDSVGGRGVHSCLSDSIKADGAPVKLPRAFHCFCSGPQSTQSDARTWHIQAIAASVFLQTWICIVVYINTRVFLFVFLSSSHEPDCSIFFTVKATGVGLPVELSVVLSSICTTANIPSLPITNSHQETATVWETADLENLEMLRLRQQLSRCPRLRADSLQQHRDSLHRHNGAKQVT